MTYNQKKQVNTVIDRIEKELWKQKIFLVAKNPDVFKSMGFNIIQREEAPNFSECFSCPDFQKKKKKNVFLK